MQELGADVTVITAPQPIAYYPHRMLERIAGCLGLKTAQSHRVPQVLRHRAAKLSQRLQATGPFDVLFSPTSLPFAHLDAPRTPAVFWTDILFESLIDFYIPRSALSHRGIRDGHAAEQRAIDRSSAAIFASTWAANAARNRYRVSDGKLHVIPFGSSFDGHPSATEIPEILDRRLAQPDCRLLFVGVDWIRKGGPQVIALATELRRRGVPAVVDCVGTESAVIPGPLPSYVRVHGFLEKANPSHLARLDDLFRQSHFFVMPSRAEAFGVVYVEAASRALPSLGVACGGVASAIRHDQTGMVFDPLAFDASAADVIEALWRDRAGYAALCRKCHTAFSDGMSWRASVAGVLRICEEVAN